MSREKIYVFTGVAWQGEVRSGRAGPGMARRRTAGLGTAWRGNARQGFSS
jgi:hypothetical protein